MILALVDDWLGKDKADLLHFVPIEWTITLSLLDYEIYMFTSRYNWLDKDGLENSEVVLTPGDQGVTSLPLHSSTGILWEHW